MPPILIMMRAHEETKKKNHETIISYGHAQNFWNILLEQFAVSPANPFWASCVPANTLSMKQP